MKPLLQGINAAVVLRKISRAKIHCLSETIERLSFFCASAFAKIKSYILLLEILFISAAACREFYCHLNQIKPAENTVSPKNSSMSWT